MPGTDPSLPPPTTEEQLRAVTIGELKQHDAPIVLVEYDPEWPMLFQREDERIRAALGDRVRLLEHVGSTSVPGLAAKPVIDIVLAVPDSTHEDAYVPPVEAAGYVLRVREPDLFEHRLFKGPDTNVNVHVFSDGCGEIAAMIRFRDRLRSSDEDRELYEQEKRRLAEREWKYVQGYADAKSAVVREIVTRAEDAER